MAAIYLRGKTYWARVQRDGKEIRESLETTSKPVATKRLQEWLEQIDKAKWSGKRRHTIDEAMLKFTDDHLPNIKPSSAKRYVVSMAPLTEAFTGLYLDEIGSARLSEFETKRRRSGARVAPQWIGKRRPKAITPSTIRRDLACLSSIFGMCMEWEWIEHNPVPTFMKARKKRGLREGEPKTRYLTIQEETKLLAAADHEWAERALYRAMCLAIDTGLREQELFRLEWAQVNLAKNQIEISTGTKNSKARQIPLLPRSAHLLAQIPAQDRTGFVLVNPATNKPYRQLNKGLAGAIKRSQIKRLTWHDLRRTCGCRLLQDHGMAIEKVSKWLGHSSVAVTEKSYAFLETQHLHDAIRTETKPAQKPVTD